MSNKNQISNKEKHITYKEFLGALKTVEDSYEDKNTENVMKFGAFALYFAFIEDRINAFLYHMKVAKQETTTIIKNCESEDKDLTEDVKEIKRVRTINFNDFNDFVKQEEILIEKLLKEYQVNKTYNEFKKEISNLNNLSTKLYACKFIKALIKSKLNGTKNFKKLDNNEFYKQICSVSTSFDNNNIDDSFKVINDINDVRDNRNLIIHNAFNNKFDDIKTVYDDPKELEKLGRKIDNLVKKIRK